MIENKYQSVPVVPFFSPSFSFRLTEEAGIFQRCWSEEREVLNPLWELVFCVENVKFGKNYLGTQVRIKEVETMDWVERRRCWQRNSSHACIIAKGGYSGFRVTGKIEREQKSKPKKISRASNKTPQKSLDQKLTNQKIPCRIFEP